MKLRSLFLSLIIPFLLNYGGAETIKEVSINFVTGETLQGIVTDIRPSGIKFRSTIAPSTELEIPLSKVSSINIQGEEKAAKDLPVSQLTFKNGTVLMGELVSVSGSSLEFKDRDIGVIEAPLDSIVSLAPGSMAQNYTLKDDQHLVTTKGGDLLYGKMESKRGNRVVVESDFQRSEVPCSKISGIYFPLGEMKEDEGKAEAKVKTMMTISLIGRGIVYGEALHLSGGKLRMKTVFTPSLAVPLDKVLSVGIETGGSRIGFRTILAWGGFADRKDEHKKTVDILKKHMTGWKIEENFTRTFDDTFKRQLFQSRTLLITEMEQYDYNAGGVFAKALQPHIKTFLQRGGNVVVLCLNDTTRQFHKDAGIIDVAKGNGYYGKSVPFVGKGLQIYRRAGASFMTTDATEFYRKAPGIEAWAEQGGGAPIVARRVGSGWVIVLGMDYYAWNDATEKILVESVKAR